MDTLRFSLDGDSLNETRGESESIKEMQTIMKEQNEIIKSLRQQNADLKEEFEELENEQQVTKSTVDKLKKELSEKIDELEAVSHACKELETANDNLSRRLEARISQVQVLADELKETKKALKETLSINEQLKLKNDNLTARLEMSDSRRRRQLEDEQDIKISRQKYSSLESEVSENNCYKRELTSATLHFPIADEIGEIMDTKSIEEPRTWQQQYDLNNRENHPIVESVPISSIHNHENNHHCINHRIQQKALEPEIDPIKEQKLRIERANELARRNMRTKPLHQTSYPLELDTFDAPDFTETDIKRGIIPRQQPVVRQQVRQQPLQRQQVNQQHFCDHQPSRPVQPPVPRKTYKKAEAFIV